MHEPKSILITGGAGFIGCNLVRHLIATDRKVRIVVLDSLTYAGRRANVPWITDSDRFRFVAGNICDNVLVARLMDEHEVDTIIHLAAESHVDRSIDGPMEFVRSNVYGTGILLECARRAWGKREDVRFHHVSTDEVFGSLGDDGLFCEDTPYDPSSPYSATKAASDHLVRAWHRTYGLPVTISNCSNNYGPYQHQEKLIPRMIRCALDGENLPVYGDGGNVRDWLYVDDHCLAIDTVVRHGKVGETYAVGASCEVTNLHLVHRLCSILDDVSPLPMGRAHRNMIHLVTDRPGHDRRYGVDSRRIRSELGWTPRHRFGVALRSTVQWYVEHQEWLGVA